MGKYIVQYGDTLISIAKEELGRESRWPEIARLNNVHLPYRLFVGQRLRLPFVQPGLHKPRALQKPIYAKYAQKPYIPVTPSEAADSRSVCRAPQYPASLALARGFLFVVFEELPEIGTGKLIRKVGVIPHDFSLVPKNPLGNLTLAKHALGDVKELSQYLSASNKSFGAASINGSPLILDVEKIQRAGAKIYPEAEVIADLGRLAAETPSLRARIDTLSWAIQTAEGETLIEGSAPPGSAIRASNFHNTFIKAAENLWADFTNKHLTRPQLEQGLANLEKSYSRARIIGRVGRVLTVIGVVFTAVDLTLATQRSINQNSFRPISAEMVRQAGGWGGAIGGLKAGFGLGALCGVETGPGALAFGAVGALIFGAIGYFSADLLADQISPN